MTQILQFPQKQPVFQVTREQMIELVRHILRCNLAFDNLKLDDAYEEIYQARLAVSRIAGIEA